MANAILVFVSTYLQSLESPALLPRGFCIPLAVFVLLFMAQWQQREKAARTQCSTLVEFFLYSKKAVVLGHALSARKTSQLDELDTESNGLKRENNLF